MAPEVTQGPYYHTEGNLRANMYYTIRADDYCPIQVIRSDRTSPRTSLAYYSCVHPSFSPFLSDDLSQLMDIGVIDIATCLPVPNLLVDLWHANTTGHYAGHADPDPALVWEGPAPTGIRKGLLTKFPRWNTEETWLRGAWPTNKNGVAQYTSECGSTVGGIVTDAIDWL